MPFATYRLDVKWDGTNWTDESAYRKSLSISRGRTGGPNSQAQVGKMMVELENSTERFTPEYSSSPLYGYLLPGKQVRLRASFGRYVGLNGSTQYLYMGSDHADFKITNEITLGAWFYTNSADTNQRIIDKTDAYQLAADTTNGARIRCWIDGTARTRYCTTMPTTTTWYFLVGTFDGTDLTVYLNGAQENTTAVPGSIDDNTNVLTVGAATGGSAFFSGRIAYPFVIARALDATEIRRMYNHGASYMGYHDDLRGYWTFYDQDATDSSGNSHTLTTAGSPTYPLLTAANAMYDAVLFQGYINSLRTESDQRQVSLDCQDLLGIMDREQQDVALQTAKTTGELIGVALDDMGWSATDRNIDTGQTTIGIAGWSGRSARTVCQDLATVESGLFYIDTAGWPTFEDRDHRRRAPHTQAQRTFDDSGTLKGRVMYDIADDDIFNFVKVTCHPPKLGGQATVWTLQNAVPYLANGETKTFYAKLRNPTTGDETNCADIVTLAATTDYTANSQADGGGADRTANLSVVQTNKAETVILECTASAALYITKLQVRGKPYEYYDPVTLVKEDTASQTTYQKRTLEYDSEFLQDTDEAQRLADMLEARFDEPEPKVGFRIYGHGHADLLQAAMTLAISDRIDITDTRSRLSGVAFFIEAIEHEIKAGAAAADTVTYVLEPVVAMGYWILGTSEFDDETIPAY